MTMNRRALLGAMAGAVAAGWLPAEEARAQLFVPPPPPTSIVLWNRFTGAWRVLTPSSLTAAGATRSGVDAARWRNVVAAVPVTRTFGNVTHRGVLTFRGSASVTPAWEVIAWSGTAWVRRAGGNLTFRGARWIPTGQAFDMGVGTFLLGTGQLAVGQLAINSTQPTAWTFRTDTLRRTAQPYDANLAIASNYFSFFGMRPTAPLAEFFPVEGPNAASWSVAAGDPVTTNRGQVLGPVSGNLLVVPTNGAGQFVRFGSEGGLAGARVVLSTALGAGWTHGVAFRYGFFLYSRTSRSARLVNARSFTTAPFWRLQSGYRWANGSIADFTNVAGFS